MITGNIQSFTFKDSLQAWEQINEMFIREDVNLKTYYKSKALYTHNVFITIEKPWLKPGFDFGRYFNYTKSKWISLVNNYINLDTLDSLKATVLTAKGNYNLPFKFENNHGHGKECLLSSVFAQINTASKPTITVFIRASEVTKRLAMDFLLIQRLGEYIYGHNEFVMQFFFNQMFNDDSVLLMYNSHKPLKDIFTYVDTIKDRKKILMGRLKEIQKGDEKDFKRYKVHFRAFKVLRPDLYTYKPFKAKDCILGGWDNLELPKPCSTFSERNRILQKHQARTQ